MPRRKVIARGKHVSALKKELFVPREYVSPPEKSFFTPQKRGATPARFFFALARFLSTAGRRHPPTRRRVATTRVLSPDQQVCLAISRSSAPTRSPSMPRNPHPSRIVIVWFSAPCNCAPDACGASPLVTPTPSLNRDESISSYVPTRHPHCQHRSTAQLGRLRICAITFLGSQRRRKLRHWRCRDMEPHSALGSDWD